MKAFFGYLYQEGYITDNPASDMKSPKIEKKAPEILVYKWKLMPLKATQEI